MGSWNNFYYPPAQGPFQSLGTTNSFFKNGSTTKNAAAAKPSRKDEKSFNCPFNCGYVGARLDLLKCHLERKHAAHPSSKPTKTKCASAPMPRQQVSGLEKSLKKVIKAEKQTKVSPQMSGKMFPCGICSYAGAKKENLKVHMQRVHGATDSNTKKKIEAKNPISTVVKLSIQVGKGVYQKGIRVK